MNTVLPRVLIMAGGTGGHVYPGLAVADVLRERGCAVAWLGTSAGLEARVVPKSNIELFCIKVRGLRGNGLVGWLRAPLAVTAAIAEAYGIVKRWRPDVILGMGGFASGPGGIAAWLSRVPLVIHEQNARAGLTNRVLAKFARRVLEAFPGTFAPSSRVSHLGNPVRADITTVPSLDDVRSPLRIVVFGGSQGASFLNEVVPRALAVLSTECDLQVLHQCGQKHAVSTTAAYESHPHQLQLQVAPFVQDMAAAYGQAHLLICRAGAMTVSELAAAGRAAILVPFPHAVDDHQSANAAYLVHAGGARMVAQSALDVDSMAAAIRALLSDPQQLIRMGHAARSAYVPQSAECVADVCMEMAR
jgi:UDP-N-acetylglucosamine--N-acetylmuramyl-(pentapeptide) pyrophosphoryl-undecaprenol N-acetylglucosamine transferase